MAATKITHATCAYWDCLRPLPTPPPGRSLFAQPGVALSRADSKTAICSDCGVREALQPWLLKTAFKGRLHD